MRSIKIIIILLLISYYSNAQISKKLTIPDLIGDGMILQQSTKVSIWGWNQPGSKVDIKPNWSNKVTVKTNTEGKWSATIETLKAGGPYTITINDKQTEISIHDIHFGEVWICSGQSNMGMPIEGWSDEVNNFKQEVNAANFPKIRMFNVPKFANLALQEKLGGSWKKGWAICTPDNVKKFSATAYFFGRELFKNLDVPVGLINASAGNTSIETWLPIETISQIKGFENVQKEISEVKEEDMDKRITTSVRFNALINPIIPFTSKGFIWYQGENNVHRPEQYTMLFPKLIESWRSLWGNENMPFYFVQIAPYGSSENSDSALLREAQLKTTNVKNTGIAVTLDIGEKEVIHPGNKQDVGKRLALIALSKDYGLKNLIYSGPIYNSSIFIDGKAVLEFTHADSGLKLSDNGVSNFEIAGEDGEFKPAIAYIKGNKLIVSSEEVSSPTQVRYAWRSWVKGTLFNNDGLPASSFRTYK